MEQQNEDGHRGSEEAKITNQKIGKPETDLESNFMVLQSQHSNITPEMLKNVYLGLPIVSQRIRASSASKNTRQATLRAFDQFIQTFEQKVTPRKLAIIYSQGSDIYKHLLLLIMSSKEKYRQAKIANFERALKVKRSGCVKKLFTIHDEDKRILRSPCEHV